MAHLALDVRPGDFDEPRRIPTIPADMAANDDHSLVGLAKTLLADRRGIENFLDATLFADPARDILLDLFIAWVDGRKITVSSACIGANVPTTTGLRWIKALTAKGLIASHIHPHDQRSRHVALTSEGYAAMVGYLRWVAKRRTN